jgi:hypothetical protein
MKKVRVKKIEASEANDIDIFDVAEDWGVELYNQGGRHLAYCPNPHHHDTHLGSCTFTHHNGKNFFYCFSCGTGGGPIDLVILVDGCSFKEALNKLGKKYGLIREELVNKKDLAPRWKGLTHSEYASFGLKNSIIRIPVGTDELDNTVYEEKRFSLRNLAEEDPELHDEMLKGKFLEKIVDYASFLSEFKTGEYDNIPLSLKEAEEAVDALLKEQKSLFEKGLLDKSVMDDVFETKEKIEFKKKIREKIQKALKTA